MDYSVGSQIWSLDSEALRGQFELPKGEVAFELQGYIGQIVTFILGHDWWFGEDGLHNRAPCDFVRLDKAQKKYANPGELDKDLEG